jgi:hypothetical protein
VTTSGTGKVCATCDQVLAVPDARYAVDWTRCADAALEVYTEDGVRIWIASPNRHLDGRSPEDCIRAGEAQRVLDYIDFLAEGNFA